MSTTLALLLPQLAASRPQLASAGSGDGENGGYTREIVQDCQRAGRRSHLREPPDLAVKAERPKARFTRRHALQTVRRALTSGRTSPCGDFDEMIARSRGGLATVRNVGATAPVMCPVDLTLGQQALLRTIRRIRHLRWWSRLWDPRKRTRRICGRRVHVALDADLTQAPGLRRTRRHPSARQWPCSYTSGCS